MINTKIILDYLLDLENNNNREWYTLHKEDRKKAEFEFEKLIQDLILEIGKFDNSILLDDPKSLTFKLVRDTRFSNDKSPYNPTFRAHIGPKGKLPIPVGYFIYLQPNGRSFIGGGLFADMFSNATSMVRDYLSTYPNEFNKIIKNKDFADTFSVDGTKLKKVPKGYDPDSPVSEYLKYKSWYLEYFVEDEIISDPSRFIELVGQKCKLMYPFNHYLNQALKEFTMPER